MHAATGAQMREVLANCHAARVPYKTIPGIDELLSGRILSAQVRNPMVQDLLGRQPVHIDEGPARASIVGRTVLVTGAAGSIGSELCRQVARFTPACLVAFDQGGERSVPNRERAQGEVSGPGTGDSARRYPRPGRG